MNETFHNIADNMIALVTEIKKGFAVSLIDGDSESIVATRIFPVSMRQEAIAYAKFLVQVA